MTGVTALAGAAVLVVATMLFNGTLWNWYAPVSTHWIPRVAQLSLGAAAMGGFVALLGNLLVCRHAIRWGVIAPLLTLGLGTLLALASGRDGALGLLLGAPLLAGISVATGLAVSFFVSGVSAGTVAR